MATINGSFSGIGNDKAYPQITTELLQQDIPNNRSLVRVHFGVQRPNTQYYIWGTYSHTPFVVNSLGHRNQNINFQQNAQSYYELVTYDTWISHNSSGEGSYWVQWDGNLGSWGTHSFGKSVWLPTIPREAYITSSVDFTVDSPFGFNIYNPANYWLRLDIHVWNGEGYSHVLSSNIGQVSNCSPVLNSTQLVAIYNAMKNTLSAGTIFRIWTFSDSGYTQQVGVYKDTTGTAYINAQANTPSFTNFNLTCEPISVVVKDKYNNVLRTTNHNTLTGSTDTGIKGVSTLKVEIPPSMKMIPKNQASGVRYEVSNSGVSKSLNYSSSSTLSTLFEKSTSKEVGVRAIDSRGLSTLVLKNLTKWREYYSPEILSIALVRDNYVDKGTKMTLYAKFSKGKLGVNGNGLENTAIVQYRFKERSSSWSNQVWKPLSLTDDGAGNLSFSNYIEGSQGIQGFDIDKSYSIEVRIYDYAGCHILESTLDKGTPLVDFTSRGVSINRKYDAAKGGSLQVDGENIMSIIKGNRGSSIIIGGTAGQVIQTATQRYVGIGQISTLPYLVPIPYSGKIRNLRVWSDGSPGAGQVYYCIMMKNNVVQELEANILEGTNTTISTTKSFNVTSGDRISLRVSLTANAVPSTFLWCVELVAS